MRKFTDYLKEASDGEMTFPPVPYSRHHDEIRLQREKLQLELDRKATHLAHLQGGLESIRKSLVGLISKVGVISNDSIREELSILVNSLGNVDKRAEEYASRLNRLD